MKRTDLLTSIKTQFDNLNYSQLQTLFNLYQELDCQCNFFMSEEKHIQFINFYFDRIRIKNVDSIKSLLYLAITRYTYESRYIDLLNIFDMMKNNYSYNQILNNFISQ